MYIHTYVFELHSPQGVNKLYARMVIFFPQSDSLQPLTSLNFHLWFDFKNYWLYISRDAPLPHPLFFQPASGLLAASLKVIRFRNDTKLSVLWHLTTLKTYYSNNKMTINNENKYIFLQFSQNKHGTINQPSNQTNNQLKHPDCSETK